MMYTYDLILYYYDKNICIGFIYDSLLYIVNLYLVYLVNLCPVENEIKLNRIELNNN